MDPLLLDLRHAVGALFHRPGFTALAILTLAVGIGVNTVAFSAINGLVRTLIAFMVLLVAIAGVLPALVPAFQATRADLLRSMKMESSTGGRPSRTRNLFVVAQVAGSNLFLAAALSSRSSCARGCS